MQNVLTAETLPLYSEPSLPKESEMTASYDWECAQADRVAERASRKESGTFAHKLQSALIIVAGVCLFLAIVAGFMLA